MKRIVCVIMAGLMMIAGTNAVAFAQEQKYEELIRYLDEQALSSVLEGLLLNRSGLFPWNRGRAERKGKGGGKYE